MKAPKGKSGAVVPSTRSSRASSRYTANTTTATTTATRNTSLPQSKQQEQKDSEPPRHPSTRSSGRVSSNGGGRTNTPTPPSVPTSNTNSNTTKSNKSSSSSVESTSASATASTATGNGNSKKRHSPNAKKGSETTSPKVAASPKSTETANDTVVSSQDPQEDSSTGTAKNSPPDKKLPVRITRHSASSRRNKKTTKNTTAPSPPPPQLLMATDQDTKRSIRVTLRVDNRVYIPQDDATTTPSPPILYGQDGNRYSCQVCAEFGNVVCCDGCPRVYHHACVPVTSRSRKLLDQDADPWYCPLCNGEGLAATATRNNNKNQKSGKPKRPRLCPECAKKKKRRDGCPKCSLKINPEAAAAMAESATAAPDLPPVSRSRAASMVSTSEIVTTTTEPTKQQHKRSASGDPPPFAKPSEKRRRKNTSNNPSGKSKRRASMDPTEQQPHRASPQQQPPQLPPPAAAVEAKPAFLFYLPENRDRVEKTLKRTHRTFNRLPKGNERNNLIASEAFQWWTELSDADKKPYIDMALQEYEQRILQWKEEKDAMEYSSHHHQDTSQEGGLEAYEARTAYEKHDRLYRQASVGSKPFKPEPDQSYHRVLLDLLHDTRFHPVPLFVPHARDDEGEQEDTAMDTTTEEPSLAKVSIPYFEVHGPISTSLGDECMGCSRGWNHFCPVLQRRLPAVEHRAKLQPPLSSLMATRVGLGLRPVQAHNNNNAPVLFEWQESKEAQDMRNLPIVPSSTAMNPSDRMDEIVYFIEETTAMKIPEPLRPPHPEEGTEATTMEGDLSMCHEITAPVHQKCGRCRTIVLNDTGCVQCRRAQLVIHKSKKPPPPSSALKVQTAMLGRIQTKDLPEVFGTERDRRLSESFLKERWCPSAILPPQLVGAPQPNEDTDSDEMSVDYATSHNEDSDAEASGMMAPPSEGDRDEENSETGTSDAGGTPVAAVTSNDKEATVSTMDVDNGDLTNESTEKPGETTVEEPVAAHEAPENGTEGANESVDDALTKTTETREASTRLRTRPSRLTVSTRNKLQTPVQRTEELKRHQKEATEIQKKALQIACYTMYLAMVRRDPLDLFATPAQADGYADMIKNPMDFRMIREDVLAGKYTSVGSFCSDAKLLCENALAFNAPNSVYYKTAEEIHTLVTAMQKRASNWIGAIKGAHAGYLIRRESKQRQNGAETEEPGDAFDDLREKWPEAVHMFENGEGFRKLVEADFMRTEENEMAFYGSIAVCRAAAAAEASLAPYPESAGHYAVVVKRKHYEDEDLRNAIDEKVSKVNYPQLKTVSSWREESVVRLAKKVQKSRLEKRTLSEHGCSRCEPLEKSSVKPVFDRPIRVRKKELDFGRVASSRTARATGLGSEKNREKVKSRSKQSHQEQLDSVNDARVSVRGSKVHGMGLFADQTFKKGEVVAEYRGEYVTNALADKRERHYRDQRIQDYQFRSSDMIVDATMKGGAARYINHNCSPNCMAKIIPSNEDPQLKRLMIIAQRDIELNEEVSYDYQFPLELDLKARIPCNCGSDHCRGFMNWDLPEKGSNNRALLVQKRGANIRDRIRRFGRPLKRDET